jgi:hypothetical protein
MNDEGVTKKNWWLIGTGMSAGNWFTTYLWIYRWHGMREERAILE